MSHHILIVEDEVKLATLLKDYLSQSGFEVDVIHDGLQVEGACKFNTQRIG